MLLVFVGGLLTARKAFTAVAVSEAAGSVVSWEGAARSVPATEVGAVEARRVLQEGAIFISVMMPRNDFEMLTKSPSKNPDEPNRWDETNHQHSGNETYSSQYSRQCRKRKKF